MSGGVAKTYTEAEARAITSMAIQEGLISYGPCSICGSKRHPILHHPDLLNRPLWVARLCASCHRSVHQGGHPERGLLVEPYLYPWQRGPEALSACVAKALTTGRRPPGLRPDLWLAEVEKRGLREDWIAAEARMRAGRAEWNARISAGLRAAARRTPHPAEVAS